MQPIFTVSPTLDTTENVTLENADTTENVTLENAVAIS